MNLSSINEEGIDPTFMQNLSLDKMIQAYWSKQLDRYYS